MHDPGWSTVSRLQVGAMMSYTVIRFFANCVCLAVTLTAAPVSKSPRYFPNPLTRSAKPLQSSNGAAIVNAASFLAGISPGGLASVFSNNLLSIDGTFSAAGTPLPTEIAGISVFINGVAAPLLVVSSVDGQDQINLQVPWDTPTGPGAAVIEIRDDGDVVDSFNTDSFTSDPGIFTYRGYALAIRNLNGQLVGDNNPVSPGDIIVLYTTGLGPVSIDVPDGFPAPGDPPADTQEPFQALINNEDCDVLFSGLAPGFTGLYQLNIRLPYDLPPGDLDMMISTPYASSGVVKIPVE
jgi:uncharacterized protein (TIGR03437 family)